MSNDLFLYFMFGIEGGNFGDLGVISDGEYFWIFIDFKNSFGFFVIIGIGKSIRGINWVL